MNSQLSITIHGEGNASHQLPSAINQLIPQANTAMASDNERDFMGSLPAEIIYEILNDCGLATRDLAAFAATSCRNYAMATPVLYKKHVRQEDGIALLWAIWKGRINTLERLVENGVDVDDYNPSTSVARRILQFPWAGRLVSWVAATGAPIVPFWTTAYYAPQGYAVGMTYLWRFTPLALATSKGLASMATWLLDHGASVDLVSQGLCNCKYELPISRYMWRGQPQTVGGYSSPPVFLWTSLHLAIHHGYEEIVKLLISRGADPLMVCGGFGDNHTALHSAAIHRRHSIIDYLVLGGLIPINARGPGGATILHLAYCMEDMNLVRKVLLYGAYVNLEYNINGNQWTIFAMACVENDFDFALELLKRGANPGFRLEKRGAIHTPASVLQARRQTNRVLLGLTKDDMEPKLKAIEDQILRIKQDQKLARRVHKVLKE